MERPYPIQKFFDFIYSKNLNFIFVDNINENVSLNWKKFFNKENYEEEVTDEGVEGVWNQEEVMFSKARFLEGEKCRK